MGAEPRILVSACLIGVPTCYDGGCRQRQHPALAAWAQKGWLVPVCPEVEGGLSTPRPASELVGGDGANVLDGVGSVHTKDGVDVTAAFVRGANVAATRAEDSGARLAVLKARSPSCGSHQVHDGTFSNTLRPGLGVTTEALRRRGIVVFSDEELDEAAAFLDRLVVSGA